VTTKRKAAAASTSAAIPKRRAAPPRRSTMTVGTEPVVVAGDVAVAATPMVAAEDGPGIGVGTGMGIADPTDRGSESRAPGAEDARPRSRSISRAPGYRSSRFFASARRRMSVVRGGRSGRRDRGSRGSVWSI
jgi:hypothetical protein